MRIMTRSSQGLRVQGSGGQTVLDAYQTIDRYLRSTLSAAHADLFAEPNVTGIGGEVDWYTPVDSAGSGVPLDSIPEPRRAQLLTRLAGLIADIRACASALKSSSKQGDRLLGQLLLLAIEVPGEEFVYAVGEQPVLIFWGHLRDVPLPENGVVDRMIARRVMQTSSPQAAAVAPAELPPAAPAELAPAAPIQKAVSPIVVRSRFSWLVLVLWAAFIALCAVIAYRLLFACALASPFGGGLWINDCPAPGNQDAAELADLEEQNEALQRQLDRLRGNAEGRRAQCAKPADLGDVQVKPPEPLPPPPEPPSPPPPPPPPPKQPPQKIEENLKSCEGAKCIALLKGCWGFDTNLGKVDKSGAAQRETYRPAHGQWCFPGEDGSGSFEVWQIDGPLACKGAVQAESPSDREIAVREKAGDSSCTDGDPYRPGTFACIKNSGGGDASCYSNDEPGGERTELHLRREPHH